MKRQLFILSMLCITLSAKAQIPVTDVASNATQLQNLAQVMQQVTILTEQKSKLDESLDFMKKVNNKLSSAQSVRYIIERQKTLSDKCIEIIKTPNLSASTLLTLTTSIETVSSNNRRLIELTNTLLTDQVKMNDAERLAALRDIEKEIAEDEKKIYKVSSIIRQYEIMRKYLGK